MNQRFYGKEVQIYVIHNTNDYIKIGITTNFDQRLQSLQGSNGGGAIIDRYWVSRPTVLYTLENMLHRIYQDYRIWGTEWFEGLDFIDVVDKVAEIMNSHSFKRCEEVRKELYESEKDKEK